MLKVLRCKDVGVGCRFAFHSNCIPPFQLFLLEYFILKPITDMKTISLIFSLLKSQNSTSFYLNTSILEATQG